MTNLESPQNWAELIALKPVLLSPKEIQLRYDFQKVFYEEYLTLNTPESLKSYLTSRIGNSDYLLMPNLFPYALLLANLPTILHCVLWFKNNYNDDKITSILTNVCTPFDFFWYENSLANRSVTEMNHVQVFVNCQDLILLSEFKKGL